jgi:phosphatidylglycerol:prolipoprotein diacylglycerol transferase
MDRAYIGFILAGGSVAAVNFVVAWRQAGLPITGKLLVFVGATFASGLAGARLYALIEQGWRWDLITSLDSGFRLPGGVIGALAGLVAWRAVLLPGISLGLIGDLGAIALQFGMVVVRLGCLAAGCCFGTVSDLPWAMRFPVGSEAATTHASLGLIGFGDAASLPVHPLQVYFMLLHLGAGLFLLWLNRRKAFDGQVLLVSILLVQGGKALLESFRQPIPGASTLHLRVSSSVLASAAALALGSMMIVRRRQRWRGR